MVSFVFKRFAGLLFLLIFGGAVHGQDHSLDFYISQGTTNNPVLKDLSNRIRSNKYDSLIARASYLPQVNFNGMMMYAPVVNGWGYSDVITNGQQLIGAVTVNQQIFNKKTREANYSKLGLENRSLENSRNLSLNELKKAITAQYLAAYSAIAESGFQGNILSTLKEMEEILQMWVEKGIYRQTDYLSVKVEIMQLERNIRDLEVQYRREFSNLNQICGISDTSFYKLNLPAVNEISGQSQVNSPLFKRFVIDSLRIQAEKVLVDRKYKPNVNWFSDGGMVNNEPAYIYQNLGVSFGLSMTLPVYDGNQRKLNYGKLRVEEETRKNYLDFFRVQYSTQLKQLNDELERVKSLARDNEKQVDLLKQLVEQEKVLLNSGALSITEYILALKNLIVAGHDGVQYQIRAQYLLNEINFLKQ